MMNHSGTRTVAAGLIALSLVGCETPPKRVPPPPAQTFAVPQSRSVAASALVTQAEQFGTDVDRLPGSSAEDHRQILVALLDNLSKMLRLANGPTESPEFQNRLAVIDAAKVSVSDPGVERRRMEAVENQALQAAGPALNEIAKRYLYNDDQLPALVQTLSDKNNTAAVSVGPMHDLDATDSFIALQAVIDRIASDMSDRFAGST